MKIKVISLGKVRQKFVLDGEAEYLPRIQAWMPFQIQEIPNDKFSKLTPEEQKSKEEEALLKELSGSETLVILDETGKTKSSKELAELFAKLMNSGCKEVTFAIGGPHGWNSSVKKKANLILSISPMTFTYQMCRLIVVEQIYRALSLIKGIPYHK